MSVLGSSDGQPLAKLALKVPSPKKTGNSAVDQQLQVEHDALVWVVDRLSKNPKDALKIQNYMLSSAFVQASMGQVSWSGGYKTLECLPKTFMLKYLLKRVESLKLTTVTADTLKALEFADSSNIPTLFSMDLQLPADHHLASRHGAIRADVHESVCCTGRGCWRSFAALLQQRWLCNIWISRSESRRVLCFHVVRRPRDSSESHHWPSGQDSSACCSHQGLHCQRQ